MIFTCKQQTNANLWKYLQIRRCSPLTILQLTWTHQLATLGVSETTMASRTMVRLQHLEMSSLDPRSRSSTWALQLALTISAPQAVGHMVNCYTQCCFRDHNGQVCHGWTPTWENTAPSSWASIGMNIMELDICFRYKSSTSAWMRSCSCFKEEMLTLEAPDWHNRLAATMDSRG